MVPPGHGVSAKGRKEHRADNLERHPTRPSRIPPSLSDSPLSECHPSVPSARDIQAVTIEQSWVGRNEEEGTGSGERST